MRIETFLEEQGRLAVKSATGQDAPALIRPTTDSTHGDYQLNGAMALGKRLKSSPREIAAAIAEHVVREPAVMSAEVAGPGFVNLRLDSAWIAQRLADGLADVQRDGVPEVEAKQRIVVDFSSPNIAKQMHVGHLRSTIIGDSICRLLRFVGHDVTGDNHLGDWGTQFGLLIVGMRTWGDPALFGKDAQDPIGELERVYKLASAEAKDNGAFAQAARDELKKLQDGDPENHALWESFVAATRRSLDQVYDRLGVTFDLWLGESTYHSMLPGVIDSLQKHDLSREDAGAECVFWGEVAESGKEVPKELLRQKEPFIVRKKDGAYLYSSTDLATLQYRKDTLKADRSVYVVDTRQGLHFKQVFALARLLDMELGLEHVGFGTVLGTDGKPLRTRDASGQVVTLASLLDEAERRAAEHMVQEGIRIPEDQKAEVARVVGIGAVKYADLRQNRSSDYQFDWDKMISFKGNAGPYIQYAYARIRSLFRKANTVESAALALDMDDFPATQILLDQPEERVLGLCLVRFGEQVHQASEQHLPHLIADHLYNLSRAFSAFYEACPVLKSKGPQQQSRLALAAMTARQLRRGLSLLGIEVLDQM